MESVVNEIITIRRGKPLIPDRGNSNRYCVVTYEPDGTRTAYCFAVPVYNNKTGKLTNLKLEGESGVFHMSESSAEITIGENIMLKTAMGYCRVSLPGGGFQSFGRGVKNGMTEIYPTPNGVLVKTGCESESAVSFTLTSGIPHLNPRANSRCFSLMSGEFKSFITVSGIGISGSDGRIIMPAMIEYRKKNDQEYTLDISSHGAAGGQLLFEINLYEPKLFQDTTVESGNPQVNNAFGGIALSAYHLTQRFCSFGSNWDNKITGAFDSGSPISGSAYYTVDMIDILSAGEPRNLRLSEGLILKPQTKTGGFTAVATGDSYYTPQVLEINFR